MSGRADHHRLLFVLPVILLAAGGTALLAAPAAGLGLLRAPFLACAMLNLIGLAMSGWPSVLGFLATLRRRPMVLAAPTGRSRTAVVMPIHNEDPAAVFAAAEVMIRAIDAADLPNTRFFVLSDTRDPAVAAAEAAEAERLQARLPFTYRRRDANHGRKAGNIAEFCTVWGGEYDYMIVLDADSLMTADAMRRLIGAMDANPRTGLIQTVPYAVNRETPFARWQQFSARLYTPLWAIGTALWQGGSSNYWGHNAIIRIAPFVQHCELPVLSGRPPFGGEILCHDVVEAGLMRRAGWDVQMLPEAGGSYEEMPANLVDYAGRERRWCQGNLQHARLLSLPGLRAASRLHLLIGILFYACGLSWAGMAALLLLAPHAVAPALAARVTMLVTAGVVLPKGLSLAMALRDPAVNERWGGRARLILSAAAEQALCVLSAPVSLAFSAWFIVNAAAGRSVGWDSQPRNDRGVSWAEAWRRLSPYALLGLALLGLVGAFDRPLLPWSVPALAGLLAAVPFTVIGSRVRLGRQLRRLGVFLTEDEIAPSRELVLHRIACRTAEPEARPAPRALPELLVEAGD